MRRIQLYLHFYKRKFIAPLALTLFVLFRYQLMPLAVLALSASTLLIWFYESYISDKKKESFYFYFNLGVSELKLYTFLFFVNLLILIGFNMYMK